MGFPKGMATSLPADRPPARPPPSKASSSGKAAPSPSVACALHHTQDPTAKAKVAKIRPTGFSAECYGVSSCTLPPGAVS